MRGQRSTWTRVSLTGIALWIAAVVLVGVLGGNRDNTAVGVTFAIGGTLFFAVMFMLMARMHFGRSESNPAARSSLRITRAYVVLGALTTALGLAAIWKVAIEGGAADIRAFAYPAIAIIVVWAAAVPWVLRKMRANAQAIEAERTGRGASPTKDPSS